jgi:LPS O-antigen subunit length determinant protein (WzzB/FepE family)
MSNSNFNNEEINLYNLFAAFWKAKYFIALISSIFAIIGILYALSLPNIYKSEATLMDQAATSSSSSNLANIAERYSGLASMAGISLGGGSATQKDASLAMLSSKDFFRKYYDDKELLKELVSFDRYDPSNNKNYFIAKGNQKKAINFTDSFHSFHEHFSFNEDIKTGLIRASFEHKSPVIAQKWLKKIILDINEYVKKDEVKKAEETYAILMNEISGTTNPDLSFMISKLAEKQIQTITLSRVTDEFAFKIIDSPYIPEKKSKPYRSWVVVLTTFLGFFLSSIIVLFTYYLGFSISLRFKPLFINLNSN